VSLVEFAARTRVFVPRSEAALDGQEERSDRTEDEEEAGGNPEQSEREVH
jgi:hypothetical protein